MHKRLHESTLEHKKTIIQRQIEATDRQMDELGYELYGLTEEERKIVEEATARCYIPDPDKWINNRERRL